MTDLESWRSKRLVQKCVTIEFTDWTYNLTIKHEKERGWKKTFNWKKKYMLDEILPLLAEHFKLFVFKSNLPEGINLIT